MARPAKSTPRDALPPAKKAKLTPHQNGLKALVNAAQQADKKPVLAAKMNGTRNNRKDRVQEATTAVSGGHGGHGDVDMADVIEISSAEEDLDLSDDEDINVDHVAADDDEAAPVANADDPIEDASAEPEDMSFGDRLRAQIPEESDRTPHIVDVESAFAGQDADSRALATPTANRSLAAPSATSLGTVLTQALRTNDQDMLDSCLRVNDVETIYATIERLPSPLVGTLLQKLAERLHKRPGRPGMLMVWVQWSLSAHGGYLATQPQLVKQLATLNKVLKERASGLQPLLSLKGRLDMLHTQLELRRRNQQRAANDEMDEAVIYVEGEEEESDEESDDEDVTGQKKRSKLDMDSADSSSVDGMPSTMEVDMDTEGSEDSEDLIDDEAEETDDDTGDDASEDMEDELDNAEDDDEDEQGSDSEDDSRPTPARRSTAGRGGMSRR